MNTTRTPELLDDVEFLGVARLDGRLVNVYSDGTLLPVICGGSSDADSGDTTASDTTASDTTASDTTSGDTTTASSDSGGESEDDEDTVVLSRSEWEKIRERLRKANKEAARRRAWLEEHGIDPRTGKPKPRPILDDSDDEPPLPKPKDEEASSASEVVDVKALQERWQKLTQREVEKAATRAEMKYKLPLARAAAEAALARAGWSGKDLSKVMKLIDIDDIDLDDDGNVIGIEEQVEDLKEEFPEGFRRPRVSSRRPAASSSSGKSTKDVGGADKPPVDTKPKDWKRRLAESALKK